MKLDTRWLLFLLIPAVVGALYLYKEAAAGPARERRATMEANLTALRQALDQYAAAHRGRYPRDGEVVEALAGAGFQAGPNPYASPASPAAPCPLVGGGDTFANPERPVAHPPGTLLYHGEPQHARYAIAGVVEGPELATPPPVTKP